MSISLDLKAPKVKTIESFQRLAEKDEWIDNCTRYTYIEKPYVNLRSPPPMWIRENERCVQWNWIAIASYTASLAVSLAIWKGLFAAVARLVK